MRYLAIALILAVGSCATMQDRPARQRLPTAAEVGSYVEQNWESGGWDRLFARFASRPGEVAALIRVENVRCDYYYGIPDCTFSVTGRFASGEAVTRNLMSNFEWRDGQLVGVVVSVHTRVISN